MFLHVFTLYFFQVCVEVIVFRSEGDFNDCYLRKALQIGMHKQAADSKIAMQIPAFNFCLTLLLTDLRDCHCNCKKPSTSSGPCLIHTDTHKKLYLINIAEDIVVSGINNILTILFIVSTEEIHKSLEYMNHNCK